MSGLILLLCYREGVLATIEITDLVTHPTIYGPIRVQIAAPLCTSMDYVFTYITSGYADDGPRSNAGFFPVKKNLLASVM